MPSSPAPSAGHAIVSTLADIRSLSSALFIQDGKATNGIEFLERVQPLIDRLRPLRGRIAIRSACADVVATFLVAAYAARRELLLVRSESLPTEDVLRNWNVAALFAEASTPIYECARPVASDEVAPALLIPTSGTTGIPKLAYHSYERLLARVAASPHPSNYERWLLTYHPASFAGIQVLLTSLLSRSVLVGVQSANFADLCTAAIRHQATHISGTPTFWRAFLLFLAAQSNRCELRQITIGGEAVDQPLLNQLRKEFRQARIVHIYASTEAGALFSVTDGRAGFPAEWLHEELPGGVRLRVSDGVLQVLSPRAMHRYVTGERANLTADGWLVTGDLVEVIGDRVLFRGRADDVINVGGAKVVPEEVEQTLRLCPAIAEVRVYGVPNPIMGQIVCADVVRAPADTKDMVVRREIFDFASARLDKHKVPRSIHFVPEIKVNSVGKTVRR